MKTEFGKKHEIARAHIDALTSGKQLATSDYDGLTTLATDMQNCYTTLNEIGFVSDINSTQTLYCDDCRHTYVKNGLTEPSTFPQETLNLNSLI